MRIDLPDPLPPLPDSIRLWGVTIGVAGLGSAASHVEALVHSGVRSFRLSRSDEDHTRAEDSDKACKNLERMAQSINPRVAVRSSPGGCDIDEFLNGVDVVIDALDYFSIQARRKMYRRCRALGIPVIWPSAVGFSARIFVFLARGPSFERYFGIRDDMTRAEMIAAQALGLHRTNEEISYDCIDWTRGDLSAFAPTLSLSSALVTAEVHKLICKQGCVSAAPNGLVVDLFSGQILPIRRGPLFIDRWRRNRKCKSLLRKFAVLLALHEQELNSRHAQPLRTTSSGRLQTSGG
jgi:molybdopterin/thiamine biosynthesis adenylyltransferase